MLRNALEIEESKSRSPVVRCNNPPTYDRTNHNFKKTVLIKCYGDGRTVNESPVIISIKNNIAKSIIYQYKKNGYVLIEKKIWR